jgi:hypothetical protein
MRLSLSKIAMARESSKIKDDEDDGESAEIRAPSFDWGLPPPPINAGYEESAASHVLRGPPPTPSSLTALTI